MPLILRVSAVEYADGGYDLDHADLVAIARGLLRDPYWPIHAERQLGVGEADIPKQYSRAY